MINKRAYYWWSPEDKHYFPSGRKPGENIRYKPSQGYGVCEIAGWLSDDIQYSSHSVNIWIKNLTDLASSPAPDGIFGMSNAHWVTICQGYVFIYCEYVEELRVILTVDQTFYVLEQYRNFLTGHYKNPDFPPEPLDVEFIAEGQEALDIYLSLEGSPGLPV